MNMSVDEIMNELQGFIIDDEFLSEVRNLLLKIRDKLSYILA